LAFYEHNISFLIGSRGLSRLACLPYIEESSLPEHAHGGIYIGESSALSIPVFLQPADMINRHILIAGISGSGKSYLVRSIITRTSAVLDSAVIVLDLTGEYCADADASERISPPKIAAGWHDAINGMASGTHRIDISSLPEKARIRACKDALSAISSAMRRGIWTPNKVLVVLDEAWKVVSGDRGFDEVVREGRKYGVGMLVASQTTEDINGSLLENFGTLFVFRLRDQASIDRVVGNCSLDQSYTQRIRDLEVGSCIMVKGVTAAKGTCAQIKKISGVRVAPLIHIRSRGENEMEIEKDRIAGFIRKIVPDKEMGNALAENVMGSSVIELSAIIAGAIDGGSDRRSLLRGLQRLGIRDDDLACAFADILAGEGAEAVR
jgi:hypothetical protein